MIKMIGKLEDGRDYDYIIVPVENEAVAALMAEDNFFIATDEFLESVSDKKNLELAGIEEYTTRRNEFIEED